MRSRIALSVATCGMLLSSFPAFAESVRVQDSSSVKVHSDERGTVTTVEERRVEERSAGSAVGASLRVQSEEAGTATRSESLRRVTCRALRGGESDCTEELKGERGIGGSASVRVNGADWWSGWRDRILRSARQVASEKAEDAAESSLTRAQVRLAKRVCSRFEQGERAACLEDAAEGDGSTVRLRLRDWIERL